MTGLTSSELTPFLRYAQDSPSLLRYEGEVTNYKIVIAPSLRSREGEGGEFMGKIEEAGRGVNKLLCNFVIKLFFLGPYHPILRDNLIQTTVLRLKMTNCLRP